MSRPLLFALVVAVPALAAAPTWDYIGDAHEPARLEDCPTGTRATISFNSGTYALWQRYCYMGRR